MIWLLEIWWNIFNIICNLFCRSYLHTITTPNKFVRLFSSGAILFSQRLTIRAHCPMDLSDFPMDRQRCPLKVASFGYSSDDVVYEWVKGMSGKKFDNGVLIAKNMELSQFELIETPTDNITLYLNKGIYNWDFRYNVLMVRLSIVIYLIYVSFSL